MRKKIYIVGLLLLLSWGVGMFFREYRKIKFEPVTSWAQDTVADCGVVLTGGAGRVREGFAMLGRKQIKKLIISGVHPDSDLADIMPYWILLGSVSEQDVVLERGSTTTYGNTQQSLSFVEAFGCRDVALITSATHMYRAYRTFRSVYPSRISLLKHAIVSSRSESDWNEVAWESMKSLFYRSWAYSSWSLE